MQKPLLFERAKICASILPQQSIEHVHGDASPLCQEQLHHIIESILPFLLFSQEQVLLIIEATLLWLTASLIGVSRFKFSVKILGDDDPPDFISQTLHQPRLVNAAVSTTSCIRPQWSVPVAQSIETPPAEGGIDTVWNIHIKLPGDTPIALRPSKRPHGFRFNVKAYQTHAKHLDT